MSNLLRKHFERNVLLGKILIACFFLLVFPEGVAAQNGCSCTNCPQFLPDNFQGNFYIQVQNAANPNLGENGQAVCGVTLHFEHDYVSDLLITLTSPAGQTVTLVGPLGLFGETDGTSWDITFVPCTQMANPDPGFSSTWNNNQNWGLFGNYTGSYYPVSGCLEDFNSGPVNGQWTLNVTDGLNNDVGNFYDYSIIFCDDTGIDCISCEASAGNLLAADVIACAGNAALDLDLPPSYAPPQTPPPANTYSYGYVVASGGVILAYLQEPDLQGYPPGTYTVCGLSYLTSNTGAIPPPNGALTLTQLNTQLNSPTPPFCGKITSNCVNVTIQPALPDVDDYETICAPDCVEYYGTSFCSTGDHTVVVTQDNCVFNATLHLTVLESVRDTFFETICQGNCAQTPGFEARCNPGVYEIALSGSNGCDSLVTLFLDMLDPESVIAPPQALHCDQTSLELDGTSSTTGSGISYVWSADAGGHIIGPENQSTVTVGSAGIYNLEVCSTSAGVTCCNTTTVQVVSEQIPPASPDTILGPVQLCFGQIETWQIDPVPGATSYVWTLPTGVISIAGSDSTAILLTWETYVSDSICVAAVNACGVGIATCLEIHVTDSLVAPSNLLGDTLICRNDTLGFRVTGSASTNSFHWEISAGGSIIEGQGTDSITLVWLDHPGGTICVQEINDCDTSAAICMEIETIQPPVSAKIEGPDTVCAGANANYSIAFKEDSVNYFWLVQGGEIIGSTDAAKIQVHWHDMMDMGEICVQAKNSCGDKTLACREIAIQELPDAFAGADTAICGLSVELRAVLSNNDHAGNWNFISGPGTVAFDNFENPNTLVQVSVAGIYMFEWIEKSAFCIQRDSVYIEFNSIPVATIAPPVCDDTNSFYSINIMVSGGTPPFSANGIAVANSAIVSAPIASGSSYDYLISDKNTCAVQITGSFDCSCTTSAGKMDSILLEACIGESVGVKAPDGFFLDGNDTAAFVLHTNAGNTLGQVLDKNTTGLFEWKPGLITDSIYYISLVVGNNLNGYPDLNDPCLSISPGQPVKFYITPNPNAGTAAAYCGQQAVLQATPGSSSQGIWSFVSGPGDASFAGIDIANSAVQVSEPGKYLFGWTVSTGKCSASDTVSIEFYDLPQVDTVQEICTGTNAVYFIQFNVVGGLPPYIVDGLGGIVNSTFFLSNLLQNNSNYKFYVIDANGCLSPELSGTHSCACISNAGSMDQTPKFFCANEPATGIFNNDEKTDGDDIIQYILHDTPGDNPGTILAISDKPIFSFLPGLKTDETYYISAVVGNNINGQVDLADPCLSVAAGTPVSWKTLPDAMLWGDTTICAGEEVLLHFGSVGTPPVTITYADNWGQQYTATATSDIPFTIPVTPTAQTVFFLQTASNGTSPVCAAIVSDSVVINVRTPAFAGVPADPVTYCAGDSSIIFLNDLLTGEDLAGQWVEISAIPSVGNGFHSATGTFRLSNQAPGTYAFSYQVTSQAPCMPDSATVQILLNALPEADAGADAFLECNTPEVTLGGTGTSSGSDYSYSWYLAGVGQSLGTALFQAVQEAGVYVLKVVGPVGCAFTDTVEVDQLSTPIVVGPVTVLDVRCFGERNGSIRVDAVAGGTPPILFSLNGSPFSQNRIFDHLTPGVYALVAQDVSGCEWADTLLLKQPSEIKIDLGPDIEAALGDSVYLWLQSSVTVDGLDTIIWAPLIDTSRVGTFEQKWMPKHSGKIKATLIDTSGCVASDDVLIRINRQRRVYIPNVFNPTAPNMNLFEISFGSDVERVETLEIFNRWGELVHFAKGVSPHDPSLQWDGTFRGDAASPGVYLIYLIVHFKDGEKELFTGTITLLR